MHNGVFQCENNLKKGTTQHASRHNVNWSLLRIWKRNIGNFIYSKEQISILARKFPWWLLESRSEEHTSELQSRLRISYAVFCLKKISPPGGLMEDLRYMLKSSKCGRHASKMKSWILYRLRSTQKYPHFEDFFVDQRWLKFRIFYHISTPCVIIHV